MTSHCVRRSAAALVAGAALLTPALAKEDAAPKIARQKPAVQMAILLDTSGSMDGLIDQARTQLWRIVTQMARTQRAGQMPRFELALIEYGKSALPASSGWMRVIVPFSTDLDKVSEELFKLRTNGGEEYCGMAIRLAVDKLSWSEDKSAFKVIFIAGNEPFTQGRVDYKGACQDAIRRGIVVNTIHCGNRDEGIRTQWKHGAELADGQYLVIDQNERVAQVSAPQDQRLAQLNGDLNKTYLAYGKEKEEYARRQEAQDKAAGSAGASTGALRAESKVSRLYDASHWDLIDGVAQGKVDLAKVKPEELPEEMKKMTPEQRKAYVEEMAKKRKAVQEEIKKLAAEREKFVAEKRRELSTKSQSTFGDAVGKALQEQMQKKGFTQEAEKK